MTYVATFVRLSWTAVGVLSFIMFAMFIVLAYTAPENLDALVHQAHDVIPAAINKIVNTVKSLI